MKLKLKIYNYNIKWIYNIKNSIQQSDYEWKTLIQNQLIITNA